MSIRAVTNQNTNPVQIQKSGVNLTTITELDARRLRDDLNRVLGDDHSKRRVLAVTVVDAARVWNQSYGTSGHMLNVRRLGDAVQALTEFDNGERPTSNFDTGVNGSAFYGPGFTPTR